MQLQAGRSVPLQCEFGRVNFDLGPALRTALSTMQMLPWIIALAALGRPGRGARRLGDQAHARRKSRLANCRPNGRLAPRPVFSTDERRVYRLLREALPHHIVLSKLPLVRFCQPTDPNEVRYWFDLLGTSHVTFAVCSANGRVLAAIDLDTDRGNSRRVMQIKQSVLSACRVRYLRCPVDQLAFGRRTAAAGADQRRGPIAARSRRACPSGQPAPGARHPVPYTVASRRAERTALWQDSTVFQDSFFAPDVARRLQQQRVHAVARTSARRATALRPTRVGWTGQSARST